MVIIIVVTMVTVLVDHDSEYSRNDDSDVGDYGGCGYDGARFFYKKRVYNKMSLKWPKS